MLLSLFVDAHRTTSQATQPGFEPVTGLGQYSWELPLVYT